MASAGFGAAGPEKGEGEAQARLVPQPPPQLMRTPWCEAPTLTLPSRGSAPSERDISLTRLPSISPAMGPPLGRRRGGCPSSTGVSLGTAVLCLGALEAKLARTGTYTRTMAMDRLIFSFLERSGLGDGSQPLPKQIVSLGAGTDTRCLRLFAERDKLPCPVVYHEIDFPETTMQKLRTVRGIPALRGVLPNPEEHPDGSWSCLLAGGSEYHCHGIDLRRLARDSSPVAATDDNGAQLTQPSDTFTSSSSPSSSKSLVTTIRSLRSDLPTLLVSEMCLCYLSVPQATSAVRYFTSQIPAIGLALYEPIEPDDAFGRMMVSNLAARHITLPTLSRYRTVEDQVRRFGKGLDVNDGGGGAEKENVERGGLGFERVKAITVADAWRQWVDEEERERVDALEGLDEVEEWDLLAGHYVVVWGWRDGQGGASMEGWV